MDERNALTAGEQCLPRELLQVSHRIGFNVDVAGRSFCESFLQQTIPEKDFGSDFRHLAHNLRDSKSAFVQQKLNKPKKGTAKRLNSKQRKELFDIRKCDDLKYNSFKSIHQIWKSYATKVFSDFKSVNNEMKLLRCDYHGALFVVCAARNPALVGLKGYVVQETKHTFRLIDKQNKITVIPKNGTVFAFKINSQLFKLNGSYFKMSSQHRSKAKLKSKQCVDDVC